MSGFWFRFVSPSPSPPFFDNLWSSFYTQPPFLVSRLPPPAAPLTWEKCFSLIFTSSSTSLRLWAASSWSLLSASSRLLRSSSNICRRACTSLSWERWDRGTKNRCREEGGERETGKYVNGRQILQNKAGDCQKTHRRIGVPIQGFVKSIPLVWECRGEALLM